MEKLREEHMHWEEEKPTRTLASLQITKKKTEKKSEEKRLEDVPIMCGFPEVFPEDILGLHQPDKLIFKLT
ncbi:hypothetical protein Tco_0630764 [Tanacetum coccineum]